VIIKSILFSSDMMGERRMKISTTNLVRASLFLAIGIVFQVIGKNVPEINQFLVGPIINCILILTAFICGKWWGVGVGVLTPVLAWLVGQLLPPMAPFIPFIMVGNFLFVFVFSFFKEGQIIKRGIGIVCGAVVKYIFLTIAATKLIFLFKLNFPAKVAKALAVNMSIPQLITALVGGAFAIVIIELLSKRKVI
jgi:hypothetical protein